MSRRSDILQALRAEHAAGNSNIDIEDRDDRLVVTTPAANVPDLAVDITTAHGCEFATLIVEENDGEGFTARYFFYAGANGAPTLIEVIATTQEAELPAISDQVHAADWHEREAEDMFGIHFSGHPFLGDFVLHDTEWPENVAPMRRAFDPHQRVEGKGLGADWQPRQLLEEQGAFAFPVGPVWNDYAESGLWLLETPGEQIRQAHSRLFYKYRGVEKIAEGQAPDQALLLAERFSGSSAFAHAYAYCQALEKAAGCEVPPRAQALRLVFAEFERMRYHAATMAELAGSTGLAVGKSRAQELQEALLRLAGEVCGHRYFFGVIAPGGLAWTPDEERLVRLDQGVQAALTELNQLDHLLVHSSSYLDRLEEMGTLTHDMAERYGVAGPVARASGRIVDVRRSLPYEEYAHTEFAAAAEVEGDGYARMRVYFDEIRASAAMIHERLSSLPTGAVVAELEYRPGAALAWVEAPAGAAFHWLRLDEAGCIARWRIGTPGFRNWHAFHRAVEGAAFQDFPIILAGFGLSVAENDR